MDKKNKLQIIFYILIALSLITGVTYAFFRVNLTGDKEYTIEVEGLTFRYSETGQGLTMDNSDVLTDAEGIEQTDYFDFNIYSDKTIKYNIYLKETDGNTLSEEYVKVYLTDQSNNQIVEPTYISNLTPYGRDTNSYLLYTTTIIPDGTTGNATQYYRLRVWLGERYETEGGIQYSTDDNSQSGQVSSATFAFKVNVSSGNLDTSGANDPELATGMIPVYYDVTCNSNAGCWRKADKDNLDYDYQWYDYNEKMWANAVTVQSTSTGTTLTLADNTTTACANATCQRSDYVNAANGTVIPMDDINTMLVWIPRFVLNTGDLSVTDYFNSIRGEVTKRYPTVGGLAYAGYNPSYYLNPGAINVTFVDNNTTAHNAFTFDGNKSGYWVGKFELSHTTLALSTTNNNLECTTEVCENSDDLLVKPNVVSLRYNDISNFFYAIRSMEKTNNSFGLLTSEIDTHMIKNNEWAAVAYLTQSIYGRCVSTTSCSEVSTNNSSEYYSGRSAGVPADTSVVTSAEGTYTYEQVEGQSGSTTGNIYGIYDMSGPSYEYVMGSGSSSVAQSGFNVLPDGKYINQYTTISSDLQHALTETKGWYKDIPPNSAMPYPWYSRGRIGIFYYYSMERGVASVGITTRLTITK